MTDTKSGTDINDLANFHDKQVDSFDKMEHWGLTLIVGAIGTMTWKLVEWVSVLKDGCLSQSPWLIIFAPFVAGIIGMLFLCITNFRCRQEKFLRYKAMTRKPYKKLPPEKIGWLGLIICTMPLFAGLGASTLVCWSRFPACKYSYKYICWSMIVLVIIGFALLITGRIYTNIYKNFVREYEKYISNKINESEAHPMEL